MSKEKKSVEQGYESNFGGYRENNEKKEENMQKVNSVSFQFI